MSDQLFTRAVRVALLRAVCGGALIAAGLVLLEWALS